MTLQVVKMGLDFDERYSERQMRFSDLGNYRLRIHLKDKEGKRLYGDLTCWDVGYWKKKYKMETIPDFAIACDLSVYRFYKYSENSSPYVGCFRFSPLNMYEGVELLERVKPYTKAGLLEFVNSFAEETYDDIEFVSRDALKEWEAWQHEEERQMNNELKDFRIK